jgi:hypothetical protein
MSHRPFLFFAIASILVDRSCAAKCGAVLMDFKGVTIKYGKTLVDTIPTDKLKRQNDIIRRYGKAK